MSYKGTSSRKLTVGHFNSRLIFTILGSSPFHEGNFRIAIIGFNHAFLGVELLEDGICAILETIAPELGEMDEETRDGVMREIRAIYEKDDSVLKSFMYEPVEEYL